MSFTKDLWILPIVIQGLIMLIDEFFFHRQRILPQWERLGHPIDTLSVLACVMYLIMSSDMNASLTTYLALSVFSCVLVTKDEWQHKKYCTGAEHWLHSVLFVLHPLVLAAFWHFKHDRSLLIFQASILMLFTFYQGVYWNVIAPKNELRRL